jgi:ribosomal protein S18 acetylase RimI-like enzyme
MANEARLVRSGRPDDATDFGRLMALSGALLRAIWQENTQRLMADLFLADDNIYGCAHTLFVEAGNRVAGMLLGYDHASVAREQGWTRKLMIRFLKLDFYTRLFQLYKVHRALGGVAPGEFLVSNVGVYPEFRKQGLGRLLIEEGRQLAISHGCRTMVLDVMQENVAAILFYERLGFTVITKRPPFRVAGREFQFLKMGLATRQAQEPIQEPASAPENQPTLPAFR